MYEQRNFAIFSLTEIEKIDFPLVLETSFETLRISTDGLRSFIKWYGEQPTFKTLRISTDGLRSFIKWDGEQPTFIATLETLEGPYTYTEILEILSGPGWTELLQEKY